MSKDEKDNSLKGYQLLIAAGICLVLTAVSSFFAIGVLLFSLLGIYRLMLEARERKNTKL